jgi:hypothetical protein
MEMNEYRKNKRYFAVSNDLGTIWQSRCSPHFYQITSNGCLQKLVFPGFSPTHACQEKLDPTLFCIAAYNALYMHDVSLWQATTQEIFPW